MPVIGLESTFETLFNSTQTSRGFGRPVVESPFVYAAIKRIAQTISCIPLKFIQNPAFKLPGFRSEFLSLYYNTDRDMTHARKMSIYKQRYQELLKTSPDLCRRKAIKAQGVGVVEIPNHPLSRLLNNPNTIHTRSQLWEATVTFYLDQGEAFWLLQRSPLGNVARIWPKSPTGWIEKFKGQELVGWDFVGSLIPSFRASTQVHLELPTTEVVRFFKVHPLDQLRGMAPSEAARSELRQGILADLYNEAFFENGAEAGTYFTSKDKIHAEKKKEILAHLNQRFQGPRNAKKNAILDAGLTPIPNMSHKDMEFVEQKKWERDTVLAIYGVSKSIIGGQEADVNRSTFSEAKRQFFELTVMPELKYIGEVITKEMIPESDVIAVFDTGLVEGLRGSLLEIADAAKGFLGAGFTRNEVNERYELGFPSAEWGDEAFGNGALVPYSKLLKAEPSSLAKTEPKSPVTNPSGNNISASLPKLEDRIKAKKEKFKWKIFVARYFTPNEQEFILLYREQLEALKIAQLNLLKSSRKEFGIKELTKEEIQLVLFAEEKWANRFSEVAQSVGPQSATSAIESLGVELGGVFEFSLVDPRILRAIEGSASNLRGVTAGIRARIEGQILQGIARKETIRQIETRLSGLFGLESRRAASIARTEVAQVVSTVRFAGMTQEGVKKKLWSTAQDEHVRPDHQIFGGSGEHLMKFNFMDLVPTGGTLHHPSDPRGPAKEVINCRCVLLAGGLA